MGSRDPMRLPWPCDIVKSEVLRERDGIPDGRADELLEVLDRPGAVDILGPPAIGASSSISNDLPAERLSIQKLSPISPPLRRRMAQTAANTLDTGRLAAYYIVNRYIDNG